MAAPEDGMAKDPERDALVDTVVEAGSEGGGTAKGL